MIRVLPSLRLAACLLLAGLSVCTAHAQIDRWTAHTSMRLVTDLAFSGEAVWAVTTGGLFSYTPATGEITRFTVADGLHLPDTSQVAFDTRRGHVWVGYQDGVLDRLDPETGALRTFRDIARSNRFPSPSIHNLILRGDSLLVATDFGLVVFDLAREEVRDTYSRFGTLQSETDVRDVTVGPVPQGGPGFWLATDEGVAYAPFSSPNLQDPAAWTVEPLDARFKAARSVAFFEGQLYVGASRDLRVREADGTYPTLEVTTNAVTDLFATPGRLLGLERFNLVVVEGGAARQVGGGAFATPTAVGVGPNGGLWVGDREEGLLEVALSPDGTQLESVQQVIPDGPFHNNFVQLAVDEAGTLWAAGARSIPGNGFYRLDAEGTWTSFTGRFFDPLQNTNEYWRVAADAQGNLWAGSYGFGVARLAPDGSLETFGPDNSSLEGITSTSPFTIIGGVATESDGTLWVSNMGSVHPLHVRTPDGVWTALPAPSCPGFRPDDVEFEKIYIDDFGQKWITLLDDNTFGSQTPRREGVLVINTGRTPADPSDDACQYFGSEGSSGSGLPSTFVTAVTEDRDGLIWIATDNGPAYLLNAPVAQGAQGLTFIWPQRDVTVPGESPFLFTDSGLRVNDVIADPANRLWLATAEGVYLVEPAAQGYREVLHFTTDNSPLFSNEVISVIVEGQSGEVFFATERGLISFEGEAVAPAASAQDLFVYPNPVVLRGGAEPSIFIEGLVEATALRILAPHGALVATLSARGGRTRWNGRDLNNELVPSGVYLVVAVGQDGEGTAYGKVAVIR